MESISFIQWCLDNMNYWTVMLLMTIESTFIPLPSEIVIPPAAYKAVMGELNIYLVVFFATVGAALGATINYCLAYFFGRPIIYRLANSRFGHACLLNQQKVENAEEYFKNYGAISTFIGRLIPGIRHLISIPAGLAKMKFHLFLFYTVIGAAIWHTILAAISYYLLSFVPQGQLVEKVKEYSREISFVFIFLAIFVIGFLVYKGMKKNNKQTNEKKILKSE